MVTTCVRDHYTWANEYPAGEFEVDGVTVRRFPAVRSPRLTVWARLDQRMRLGLGLTLDEQFDWLNGHVRVPALFHHLLTAGSDYRAVVFSPYLFWTTAVVAPVVAERAIVVPCLHDEAAAYLDVFRPLLASPAQVWFLSEPEHELAHRLGPLAADHRVIGSGVPDAGGLRPRRIPRPPRARAALRALRRPAGGGQGVERPAPGVHRGRGATRGRPRSGHGRRRRREGRPEGWAAG